MGAREAISNVDQTKKLKNKKKVFSTNISTNSGCRSKFLRFSSNSQVKTENKGLRFYEIPCESTKITKRQFLLANSRAVYPNWVVLGLDLHSSTPETVNFFGSQSSLGGHNFHLGGHKQSFGGARPWNAPRGAGPGCHRATPLIVVQ